MFRLEILIKSATLCIKTLVSTVCLSMLIILLMTYPANANVENNYFNKRSLKSIIEKKQQAKTAIFAKNHLLTNQNKTTANLDHIASLAVPFSNEKGKILSLKKPVELFQFILILTFALLIFVYSFSFRVLFVAMTLIFLIMVILQLKQKNTKNLE